MNLASPALTRMMADARRRYTNYNFPAFAESLRAVGQVAVTDIEIGRTPGKLNRQTVTLNRCGAGFDLLRFRCPDDADPPIPGPMRSNIVQALVGNQLQPGREYLLWLRFFGEEPAEVDVAINLVPDGDDDNVKAWILSVLGLAEAPAPD